MTINRTIDTDKSIDIPTRGLDKNMSMVQFMYLFLSSVLVDFLVHWRSTFSIAHYAISRRTY
jgi:hypothetical protein